MGVGLGYCLWWSAFITLRGRRVACFPLAITPIQACGRLAMTGLSCRCHLLIDRIWLASNWHIKVGFINRPYLGSLDRLQNPGDNKNPIPYSRTSFNLLPGCVKVIKMLLWSRFLNLPVTLECGLRCDDAKGQIVEEWSSRRSDCCDAWQAGFMLKICMLSSSRKRNLTWWPGELVTNSVTCVT